MCLAVVALDAHPRYALIVAANRDEAHARPTRAAGWWDDAPPPGILGGRDLEAGGGWFGITRRGRWALVTNVREGLPRPGGARSRGGLVPAVLRAGANVEHAVAAAVADGADLAGFNLLAGDGARAAWGSNRSRDARSLAAGVHGLSNAALDTPWPKLLRLRETVADWSARGKDDVAPLFDALADRSIAADAALPSTGVPLERERLLSAAFIVTPQYGTRCSTILTVGRDGRVRLVERSFDAAGRPTGTVLHRFLLDAD